MLVPRVILSLQNSALGDVRKKAQSIMDDARIMSYDIPIILAGGIDGANMDDAMSTGAYGFVTNQLSGTDELTAMISKYPIR